VRRSRFTSGVSHPGVHIEAGQEWVRKPDVPVVNSPFSISIKNALDRDGARYEVSSSRGELFFDRADIAQHYERRDWPRPEGKDAMVAEILGWRFIRSESGEMLAVNPGKLVGPLSNVPRYSSSVAPSEELLRALGEYQPVFSPKMGLFEIRLIVGGKVVKFKGKTRPAAICEAFLGIFG
jgi:hypothetical protein